MSRRGFTVVELAIVLSISIILIPLVYSGVHAIAETHALGLWHLHSAEQLRTVTEELRLDARAGAAVQGTPLTWRRGACLVSYRVDEHGVLSREADEACGGTRALATGVTALDPVEGGVELELTRILRPTRREHTRVFIPVEEP